MRIAIVGCAHGELDKIYDTAFRLENQRNEKIDLIICCGDFQATRNESDLRCMAVPEKFYNMGSFYKYYSGECVAPILTLFIGGNHEASNYLQELPYGGWVAPNIYYMGYAGVINVGNIRIGGISGIFKPFDYMKGHYERAPFNNETKRSVYHVRNVEVFRLKQLSGVLDVMLSHDWPKGVYNYGSKDELLKNKPFFRKEVNENMLGSQPNEELLYHLKPKYWFSAHLHTKFSALIPHNSNDDTKSEEISNTKFLALDKCLPKRKYFELIEIPSENDSSEIQLSYDLEWLTILYLTDHLMSSKRTVQYMPGPNSGERWSFTPTEAEKEFVLQKMGHDLKIPTHFEQTTPSYGGDNRNNRYSNPRGRHIPQPRAMLNPQTIDFCLKLGIKDPLSSLIENLNCQSYSQNTSSQGYDESAEYPTFLEGFPTPSKDLNQDAENADNSSASDELSNENSLTEKMSDIKNSTSGSAEYLSFVNDSLPNTLLSDYTSTPESIMKKRKFSFPSFKEPTEESPSADMLPFEIDRTGNAPNSETPAREKKIFKRRNGNIYQND